MEDGSEGLERAWFAGGAGGGMDKSTGEGGAPAILSFRDLVTRNAGVQVVDLYPRVGFLGLVGLIAGERRLRSGLSVDSSPLSEAARLWRGVIDCWLAPSQGLVRGDISKSTSAGSEMGFVLKA